MEEILKDNNNNYIKNISALNIYNKTNIKNDIILFYFQINQLKNIYRQGFIKSKFGESFINKCESVADHCFGLSLLCISIIEKYNLNYDICKCLKLCLIHEFGEVYAGDYTPQDNLALDEKHELEKRSVIKILELVGFENDFLEIWEEYENQSTKESIFIKELDSLEFLMQSAVYELDISFCKISINRIKTPIFREILEELMDITKNKKKPIILPKL